MGVIFVAGVHAVGKTTACSHAAGALNIAHYTASGLIKAEKATAIPLRGKVAADIEGNQHLLIRGVRKALDESKGRMILDGHFSLPDTRGEFQVVELEVFRALTLSGVVVFHDEPEAIVARRHLRDGERHSRETITHHQELELAHARLVSAELQIPLKLLAAFDSAGLVETIGEWC